MLTRGGVGLKIVPLLSDGVYGMMGGKMLKNSDIYLGRARLSWRSAVWQKRREVSGIALEVLFAAGFK